MTEVQAEEKKQDPIVQEEKEEKEPIKEKEQTKEEEEQTKENGVEESDGESSEEELGSLEKPVEILDRKRDRKSTDRLALEKYTQPKTPKDELDFSTGKGVKFGDIAYIKHQLDKNNAEELKTLHRILFLKVAKGTMVKKNIRTFCGYPFEKDSKLYTRVDCMLDKIVMPQLRFILGVLGLEKTGDKTAIKERMLEFLMKPINTNKEIAVKKKKAEKKKSDTKKKSKAKKTKSSENVNDDVSSASEDSDDEDEEKKDKKKKSVSPKKKATPKKDTAKKTEKKKTKTPAIKLPTPKKKKESPKKRKADDDSEDDEPLVKKSKGEPTDSELKKCISSILQGADLEQVTMKTVVKQVYEKYPDFDLSPRKDFIKNTVKEIIS